MEIIKKHKKSKDHMLVIRTDKQLVNMAKTLGINISETLHQVLKTLVENELKRDKNEDTKDVA